MKRFMHYAMLAAYFMVFPLCANASIIGDVNLTLQYSAPTGSVTFPGPTSGNYYLDYDVLLNSVGPDEAFCVENKNAPSSTTRYTLLSIDSGLSAFGLDVSDYLAAAWVAEYYYTNKEGTSSEEEWKAGAQIAIWEIIFDSSFDLTAGTFRSADNVYRTNANLIWNDPTKPSTFPTASSHWALAVNPTVTPGGTVNGTGCPNYQNYLVHYDVPEPATLLLLGLGLVGLAGVRKKNKK